MLISIVNHSKTLDPELQEVIRAINRQVREDFEPYWSRSARLRLEGTSASSPRPESASDMRGEGVIYLCEDVASAQDALGYHEINHRGIPYGFVFKDLCKELKESWTITLSHEVLELILDPETNLLVKGPHPDDPTREVYHWYEACDAVQSQKYAIDGIEVSNFVLPLYFTTREEKGGRNDFLGARDRKGPLLASFGVSPGGYIGFYDPESGDDETYEPTEKARRRREIKLKAGLTRRGLRYQRNAAPLGYFDGLVGATAPPPELECITLAMVGERGAATRARDAVRKALGSGWNVQPLAASGVEFDVVPRKTKPDARRAWELTYRLRAQRGVARAEPLFEARIPDDEGRQEVLGARMERILRASGGSVAPDAPADPAWSMKLVRVDRAWKLLDDKQRRPGEGIRIGHPDTGFTPHPELPLDSINLDLDHDFVDDDSDALDPMQDGLLRNPGHGTGTGSVIVSPEGAQRPGYEFHVTGIAPAAELVPMRVSRSVVQQSMRNLRDAIDLAAESGCHVISISLGGLPSGSLHDAIRRATRKGVIVVAAAGNYVRLVVWPARYDEVLSVAACNEAAEPWSGSSRGDAVDVTGPGEAVYRAYWAPGAKQNGGATRIASVGPSDGTSYATATVAGVAALWLSYHDREKLLEKYPGELLPLAFRTLLESTCRKDVSLPEDFGRGLIDAEALLRAPLPAAATLTASVRGRRPTRGRRVAPRLTRKKEPTAPLGRLTSLFAGVAPEAARAGLAEILGIDRMERAAGFEDELIFRVVLDPAVHVAIASHMQRVERAQKQPALRAARAKDPGAAARLQQVRAALTASGVSSELRERLWNN